MRAKEEGRDSIVATSIRTLSGDLSDNQMQNGDKNFVSPNQNGSKKDMLSAEFVHPASDKNGKEDDEKKEKKADVPKVSFLELFRFSTALDKFLIFIATLSAIVTGACQPAMVMSFGDLTESMVQKGQSDIMANESNPNMTLPINQEEFLDSISYFGISNCVIGSIMLVMSYVFVSSLNYTAERQIFRIRSLFLQAALRQDIGWYDVNETGGFSSRMSEDLTKLEEGIGEKVGMFVFFLTTFLGSLGIAFYHGWELTLICLCSLPVIMVSMGLLTMVQTRLTKNQLEAYAKAGSIATEVLGSIRTVVAFGGQKKEIERYDKNLIFARNVGSKIGLFSGIGVATLWFVLYCSYALAFWYGVGLIIDKPQDYSASTMIIVFFGVMMGSMNIGQTAPYLEAFSIARGAAVQIFAVIDRIPPIDSLSQDGEKLDNVNGSITFENVHFNYPSRSDVKILQGLNLQVKRGETVALVGGSGCGKSTCIQLIQRFYDPLEGSVKLDGKDIKNLNVASMRKQIGVVGQEPVLFGTTIAENIRYGREGTVSDEEIIAAAKEANAHDFVVKLPLGYETLVGERGAQLSGGQKQRIAIARALVRKPAILLLDEATSALDTSSEAKVQNALDKASKGRTTIIVAHRLSTIRGADKIVVLNGGKVTEQGTHNELMKLQGHYYDLVTAQVRAEDETIVGSSGEVRPKLQQMMSVTSITSDQSAFSEDDDVARTALTENDKLANDSSEDEKSVSMMRILSYNKPERVYILVGVISALLMGCSTPAFAVIFGDILGVLQNIGSDEAKVREDTNFYAIIFVVIGIIAGAAIFLQLFMFAIAGERLTMRLRTLTFSAMIKQEIGWFDNKNNSVGSLTARLSGDAASIQGATGSRIGTIVQSAGTLALGIGLAMYYEWKLGLLTLAFAPVILVTTYFQTKIIRGQSLSDKDALEKATKIAVEAVGNIRTVASLNRERTFHIQYVDEMTPTHQKAKRNVHVRGIVFGISRSVMFFAYAACMFYGGQLIEYEGLDYANVFKVSQALIMGTVSIGNAMAFAPNFNKAMVAAAKIFNLLDRKPQIYDPQRSKQGSNWIAYGNVTYSNVDFFYPTRPTIQILNGLDLKVHKGQTVALVGPSGCGKSTCIQLLERFYDPVAGKVSLDENEIDELSLNVLRSQMGIVSQEPVLFDRTIAENIAYGDNSRQVSMDEVIEAAKQANIHSFISSLPLGYETGLGEKGTQLSGGQKQRVAIARALVRDPHVLLLDEATSALDAESEKIVQEALDKAKMGRTCIVIAHRLSTIQDADMICVINHGRVSEAGTHQELMSRKGLYYKLQKASGGKESK